ncbi:hypothetical protein HanRHA438_Chr16g0752751 [Helianthus annuus]|nr:hypothetical protein HanIR_Chr16g0805261 [Helianthus annuus]KAJ0835226.1 hypothetical protein HanRHA438_Chr16g0752751 [Helianthus annuus]
MCSVKEPLKITPQTPIMEANLQSCITSNTGCPSPELTESGTQLPNLRRLTTRDRSRRIV